MRVLREDLEISTVDDCVVIVLPNGDMAIMNETASFMIEKLQCCTSRDDVVHQVASHYDANPMVVSQDISDFLADLKSYSLLA